MTKPNPYLWPKGTEISCYNGRGKCFWSSKDRKLDLEERIMNFLFQDTHTTYLGFTINNENIRYWDENTLTDIERLIRRDIAFDEYNVTMKRLSAVDSGKKIPCTSEFRWKLIIRRVYKFYSGGETMEEQEVEKQSRTSKPIRYAKARSDASIDSIQATIESKFGLPEGSIKIVYPSGVKARRDSTVGALRKHWDRKG